MNPDGSAAAENLPTLRAAAAIRSAQDQVDDQRQNDQYHEIEEISFSCHNPPPTLHRGKACARTDFWLLLNSPKLSIS
jgi:hypothetical protein